MNEDLRVKKRGIVTLIMIYIAYLAISFLLLFVIKHYFLRNNFLSTSIEDMLKWHRVEQKNQRILLISQSIIFLVFISGYYSVITDFIRNKISLKSFFIGLKRFIFRVFIIGAFLLIGISIVSVSATIIDTLVQILLWSISIHMPMVVEGLFCLLYYSFIFALFYPLVIFWFPSLFVDDIGVIKALKNSISVGKKNYCVFFLIAMSYSIFRITFYYAFNSGVIPITTSIFDIVWLFSSNIYTTFQIPIMIMQFLAAYVAFIIYERKQNIEVNIGKLLRAFKSY